MLIYIYAIFIVFDIIAMAIAGWAQYNVNSNYNYYSGVATGKEISGYDVAKRILDSNGINDVQINCISGKLTDHYHPKKKQVNLSKDVYSGTSIASIAVAAHECGHAIQYQQGYFGIKVRNFVIPLSNFISRAMIPLVIIGILFTFSTITFLGTNVGDIIIIASLVSLGLSVLVNLVTLPVEFDASRRALKCIEEMGIVDNEEYAGTREMLKSAALTYVAALAVSLIYLLRFIFIVLTLRGRDEWKNYQRNFLKICKLNYPKKSLLYF